MPLLTPEQILKLQQIIRDGSLAVAITTFGYEVPPEELQRLVDDGFIDPDKIENIVKDSFSFGQLMDKVEGIRQMGLPEFEKYLKKNPVSLSVEERHAYDIAKQRAGTFCVGLGNRYADVAGQRIVTSDHDLAEKVRGIIRDETAVKVVQRKTMKQLKSALSNATKDWGRDWDRIAQTESHLAHQEGFLKAVVEKHGDEELLAKIPEPTACEDCNRLYLENGKPKVRPASWWEGQGVANVGRKRKDWQPVLGAMHPFCRCQLVRVPAGWGFNDDWDLVPAELLEKSKQKNKGDGDFFGTKKGIIDSIDSNKTQNGLIKSENVFSGANGSLSGAYLDAIRANRDSFLARKGNRDKKDQSVLQKGGGPYIGPRGGKWADPEHKIPWKMDVTVHHRIGGSERKHTYHVVDQKEGKVQLSRDPENKWGPWMPKKSVKHFVSDLSGKVDIADKKSGHVAVDAVLNDKGEFLGKGDDGLAFKVGDQIVKVSTTVPFQPENQGHRTPEGAVDMLKKQVEIGNEIAVKVPGVQKSQFVEHGGKGFQIKSYVDIPKKFTREQLDQAQDILIGMHKAGYALNDDVQIGLDPKTGKVFMFDVGKAGKMSDQTGIYSDVVNDMENMERLYRDNGHEFVRRDYSKGQQMLDFVETNLDKMLKTRGGGKFAKMHYDMAVAQREKELKATLSGEELENALKDIESKYIFTKMEIDEVLETEREIKKSEALEKARKLDGRLDFQGFKISIENKAGSYRNWYDPHTKTEGKTKMVYPYGYIRLTEGADGDHVDVFVGPNKDAKNVYVVHQMKAPFFKEFDEDKCLLGFESAKQAKQAYLKHFDNPKFFGSMTAMPLETFRKKVYSMKRQMIKSQKAKSSDSQMSLPFADPISELERWEKAVSNVGIPLDQFHLVVKYAQKGHGEARKALDAVYAELKKGFGSDTFGSSVYGSDPAVAEVARSHPIRHGKGSPVGTMGHHSKPARMAGENVRSHKTAKPQEDWPPQRKDMKKKNRRLKRNLQRAAERLDVVGESRGKGGWAHEEYDPDLVVGMDLDQRRKAAKDARENLEVQQKGRMELREGSKLADLDVHQ